MKKLTGTTLLIFLIIHVTRPSVVPNAARFASFVVRLYTRRQRTTIEATTNGKRSGNEQQQKTANEAATNRKRRGKRTAKKNGAVFFSVLCRFVCRFFAVHCCLLPFIAALFAVFCRSLPPRLPFFCCSFLPCLPFFFAVRYRVV